MAFDRTKPYRARDGRKAEIVATLKDGRLLVVYDDGEDHVCLYADGGRWNSGGLTDDDLVNIPDKRVVVINHYPNGSDTFHCSLEEADKVAAFNRQGRTVLEYERSVFDGE